MKVPSSPSQPSALSAAALAARVLSELTRLYAYVACQGCGGTLEAPALLAGCAHAVCSSCAARAAASRDPACPVRGCALPLTPKDLTPDTASAHIVECVGFLEKQAAGLADMLQQMNRTSVDKPLKIESINSDDWWLPDTSAADVQDAEINDMSGIAEERTQPPPPPHLASLLVKQESKTSDSKEAGTTYVSPSSRPTSSVSRNERLTVCLSKVPSDGRKKCELICRRFGIEYIKEWTDDVKVRGPTLVVTPLTRLSSVSDSMSSTLEVKEMSFSILFGMIWKLDIVSPEWLFRCEQESRILERDDFRASYNFHDELPVFNGVVAYFEPEHDDRIKHDITRLIVDGGGDVFEDLELFASCASGCRLRIRIVPDSALISRSCCDEASVPSSSQATDTSVKRVDFAWLADCIRTGTCPPANHHIFETCLA